ncbi:nucleolar protein 8 [Hoplias malabaricus]|uniref:nucleolar protein 8 n=1 Tax=Hoplias malabaricus TaxID=27720 RepID=UPI0034624E80
MKRLYVGGLSHTISEKDIRDRFGKFGEVSDVEIKTRTDELGSPLKTFCYINISISDADYKRCMSVLNKSKWKGGTLQIELAKESFLHRLAEERQKAAEKTHAPGSDPKEKVIEAFKAAGVENFHMKAAVPGTEIPGHKNWVVSKFGRVLPVLHLKCQGKKKVLKYDPSKHCHNIKKLEAEEGVTPVSKLTWELDGGDDEISKKRRGEFPPQKKRLKKATTDLDLSSVLSRPAIVTTNEKRTSTHIRGVDFSAKQVKKPHVQNSVFVLDSDIDSDYEIEMLVAQEHSQNQKKASVEEEDNLEVVGDDFLVTSNMFWGRENGVKAQRAINTSSNDEEYDSADTDEILTQSKTPGKAEKAMQSEEGDKISTIKSNKGKKKVMKKTEDSPKSKTQSDNEDKTDNSDGSSSECVDSEYEALMGGCYRLDLSLGDLENLVKNTEEASDDEESDDAESKPQAGSSQLPKSSTKSSSQKCGTRPEDILAYLFGSDVENEKTNTMEVVKSSLPAFVGTKSLFGPSPSGSGLKRQAEKNDCELKVGPKRSKEDNETMPNKCALKYPSGLSHRSAFVDPQASDLMEKNNSEQVLCVISSSENSSSSDEVESNKDVYNEPEVIKEKNRTPPVPKHQGITTSLSQVHCNSNEINKEKNAHENHNKTSDPHHKSTPKWSSKADPSSSSSSSSEESETSSDDDEEEEEEEGNNTQTILKRSEVPKSQQTDKNAGSHSRALQPCVSDPEKQQQDNLKRLAALELRQKEAEQQKKLIQGALSKLDNPNPKRGKHIVFDSDEDEETSAAQKNTLLFEDDDDEEEEEEEAGEKHIFKEKDSKKAGGSRLFDDSENEEDEAEEDHFQIKPQFEGKAGQKLMELQSRFGTDPRFQMTSKFLENDNEEEEEDAGTQEPLEQELVEEKKKNLAILQNVLNISIQPSDSSKEATKAKTFRDVSALHYDPTKEAHAAFETKAETPNKESKAARRRRREEAEKLPEVSKEIFYDVTVDLKEVFGSSKENQNEQKEKLSWDKEEDESEDTALEEHTHKLSLSSGVDTDKDSSAFRFSFFGDDSTTETPSETGEYKIETLKGAKVSWQVDPRFQDSSSDEEDVENEEKETEEIKDQSLSTTLTTEEPGPIKSFFFFHEGDLRLKEGPRLFCRSEKLEDQREAWEEKRSQLKEEYRKKHKDARRRQKATMKN